MTFNWLRVFKHENAQPVAGDIFYLHSRLLERAAKLSPALGGGSLTALPIAETDAGNLAAYIPTNLISITDGQLVMDAALFAANQRPAVNVGLSVSRVGGKAQSRALRQVAGQLRLDYAQFLELEMFTRFGGLTDARVNAQIARGERIRGLLAQPRFSALGTAEQAARRARRRRIRCRAGESRRAGARVARAGRGGRAAHRFAGRTTGARRCTARAGAGAYRQRHRQHRQRHQHWRA